MSEKKVRRPRIDVDLRGLVSTHGTQIPVRGVVHDTECGDLPGVGEMTGVARFWQRQHDALGAELMIDKDGLSGLCADPWKICWAVAGRNTGTYHVELIGWARFTRLQWLFRRKQLDKLARWMAWLNMEYGIPLEFNPDKGWSGHRNQPHQTHIDPGPYFPWKYVLKQAQKYRAEGWY